MRFSTDEIKPFYEVRQNLSKAIDEVERDGGEVVIVKHGTPIATSAASPTPRTVSRWLFRRRKMGTFIASMICKPDRGIF